MNYAVCAANKAQQDHRNYCYLTARYGGSEAITKAYDQSFFWSGQHATKKAGDKIGEWVKKGYFPEGVNLFI